VEVPYWWDLKSSSLAATIHEQRPDLSEKYFPNSTGTPIPKDPPQKRSVSNEKRSYLEIASMGDSV